MKNLLKISFLFALTFIVGLFSGCEEDEITTADVTAHIHAMFGSDELQLNTNYAIDSTVIQFTLAQFYAGGFQFDATTNQTLSEKYLLVKSTENEYVLGKVNDLQVSTLKFFVGVDSLNNHQTEANFTSRTSDDPLAQQSPAMHWNWNSGYIFVKIEGLVDQNGDGTPEAPFQLHIGVDDMRREVSVPLGSVSFSSGTGMVHLTVDYAKVLEGLNVETAPMIHGKSAKLMDNLAGAFAVE